VKDYQRCHAPRQVLRHGRGLANAKVWIETAPFSVGLHEEGFCCDCSPLRYSGGWQLSPKLWKLRKGLDRPQRCFRCLDQASCLQAAINFISHFMEPDPNRFLFLKEW